MYPTLAGFYEFIRNVMGITTAQLPDGSYAVRLSYNVATAIVNRALLAVPSEDATLPSMYALAIYNFAGDRVINFAPDVPDAPVYQNKLPFFAYMRQSLNINGFVGGVIQSSADEGTSESMVVPEAMKEFTMRDLQTLKTPWGREYMSIAQDYGSIVGIS